MATMITGPGSNPGMDQINQAFGNIFSMFGGQSNLSGGGSGPFGTSPQSVPGGDNSLTQQQRATGNLAGQMAPTAFNLGTGLIGTGTGVAQGGLDVMGTGLNTTETGLSTLQPSIDFYNKLVSGDPATMTAALAPTAANLSTIATGATNQASQGMPAGGYRASTMAGLPFAQLAQINNAALQLQPQAAQALAQLGGEQANIGAQQGQIGQGMAGVGTTLSGQGINLTGQGLQSLLSLYNALINKQQVNQQSTPLTAFDQFASGLGNLASGAGRVMTGVGNLGGGGGG